MAYLPHVVRQGEYVAQLALRHSCDADEVWNHPKNADLKALRSDPNVLAPGDIMYLPEPHPTLLPLRAGTLNRYVVTIPKAPISLRLRQGHAALASEAYRLEGGATPPEGVTDSEGKLRCSVPVAARVLRIVIPRLAQMFTVLLGHLDPVEHKSGFVARLVQLGYLRRRPHGLMGLTAEQAGVASDEPDDAEVSDALRAFQHSNGLPETGAVDTSTADALRKAHGA